MREIDYYNIHADASSQANRAKTYAENQLFKYMVQHLNKEHGMGVRKIAKRLGLKMKEVKYFLEP